MVDRDSERPRHHTAQRAVACSPRRLDAESAGGIDQAALANEATERVRPRRRVEIAEDNERTGLTSAPAGDPLEVGYLEFSPARGREAAMACRLSTFTSRPAMTNRASIATSSGSTCVRPSRI